MFCFHRWTIKSKGHHYFQKGEREKIYFWGTLKECSKCHKEKFRGVCVGKEMPKGKSQ